MVMLTVWIETLATSYSHTTFKIALEKYIQDHSERARNRPRIQSLNFMEINPRFKLKNINPMFHRNKLVWNIPYLPELKPKEGYGELTFMESSYKCISPRESCSFVTSSKVILFAKSTGCAISQGSGSCTLYDNIFIGWFRVTEFQYWVNLQNWRCSAWNRSGRTWQRNLKRRLCIGLARTSSWFFIRKMK